MPFLQRVASTSIFPGQEVAAANTFDLIGTASGTGAQALFQSVPQTYTHLQIRVTGKDGSTSAGQDLAINFNNDAGTNYAFHRLVGSGSTLTSQNFLSTTYTSLGIMLSNNQSTANFINCAVIDIFDYSNTSKTTTMRAISGWEINSASPGVGYIGLYSAFWNNTAAVTEINLRFGSGTANSFTNRFALYGIR